REAGRSARRRAAPGAARRARRAAAVTDAAALRRRYAEEVCRVAGAARPELVEAFARVPREHFLGPWPWLQRRAVARSTYPASWRAAFAGLPERFALLTVGGVQLPPRPPCRVDRR